MKVVIIGGVAGGATAAARLRRLDEYAEIVLLERSGFISYANCGLPYYVGGVIQDRNALTLQTPESFWSRFRIDVRVHNEATAIHPESKYVTVKRLDDNTVYEESYDKLILAPGAKPVRPPLPGIDGDRIFTLRTVEDTLQIREFVETKHPASAVVIGGGFIGLEMAENLIHSGVKVTLVEMLDQVMPPLDYDMACGIHGYLRDQGIDLCLQTAVTGFERQENGITVSLKDRGSIQTDMVLLSIGVSPDTYLAKETGILLGAKGAIAVNDRMETSIPDIYAVGDAVEIRHFVTGDKAIIPLAGPANKEARIAADNICGINSRYRGAQGSSIVHLFEMTVAMTGLNEKTAKASGIVYDKVVTFSPSHASYYPGGHPMTIKTLFDPETGKILGAHLVGFGGVDKRCDVLAEAIRAGLTGEDLTELELAYAPPYSSAKDPVNIAGYVIQNVRSGLVKQYHWDEVDSLPRDGSVTLLDVRTQEEYTQGAIPGTVHIPVDVLREHLDRLDPAKPVYVNCQSGLRSYLACRILAQKGFECYNLSGGYQFYERIRQERAYGAKPAGPCGIEIK